MRNWRPIESAPKVQGLFEAWGPMVIVTDGNHLQESWFEDGLWRSHREYGERLEEIAVPLSFEPTHWRYKGPEDGAVPEDEL